MRARALALGLVGLSTAAGSTAAGAMLPGTALAQPSLISDAVRVDGVAFVVGGLAPGKGVVTLLRSDVELRARLSLLRAGSEAAALGPLPERLLRAVRDELLGEALLAVEATRLGIGAPSRSDIARERQRMVRGAGGAQVVSRVLSMLGVNARELDQMAARRAQANAFMEANLAGASEVTQAEIDRAYESEDHPFRDRPLEEAREPLRALLAQRRLEEAVARWISGLAERVPHRLLTDYGSSNTSTTR